MLTPQGGVRRVAVLKAQLAGSDTTAAAAPSAEPPSNALRLLAEDELKRFVATGFIVINANTLSQRWHLDLAVEAEAMTRAHAETDPPITGSDHQDAVWGALTPRIQRVIQSPALQGALTSILGCDFVFGGGAHMHVASPTGQVYHKDGTPVAVKCHEPRGVIMLYYPNGATMSMGPTAVCPSSMFFGRDLYMAPDLSEQHDVHRPPSGLAAPENQQQAKTDALVAIGMPRSAQVLVTVPPGAVLICHEHLYHRGTPAQVGATFRPAFKMAARRVSEPHQTCQGHSATEPFGFTAAPGATQAIMEEAWRWLCGRTECDVSCDEAAVSSAAATLQNGPSEVERTGAAYTLARVGPPHELEATTQLLACATATLAPASAGDGVSEGTRRAAFYGLRALLTRSSRDRTGAGASAMVMSTLLSLLAQPFVQNHGTVGGTAAMLFCLAASPPDQARQLLSALRTWVQRTRAELAALQSEAVEGHSVPPAIEDRRRAMVEAMYCMARAGVHTLEAGLREDTLLVAKQMLQTTLDGGTEGADHLNATRDGGSGGNKAHGKSVAHSAAVALLKLCSDATLPSSMYGRPMGWPVGWQGNDACVVTAAETVGEALRRLRKLVAIGSGSSAQEQSPKSVTRQALLRWLEGEAGRLGPQWMGAGEWSYIDCEINR
eukprot:COSAG05_NODE_1291_length_5263_cov_29.410147_2_plen_663_part_00